MLALADWAVIQPILAEIVKGIVSILGAVAVLVTPIGVIFTKIATSKDDAKKQSGADMQATIDGLRADLVASRAQLDKCQQRLDDCYQSRQTPVAPSH